MKYVELEEYYNGGYADEPLGVLINPDSVDVLHDAHICGYSYAEPEPKYVEVMGTKLTMRNQHAIFVAGTKEEVAAKLEQHRHGPMATHPPVMSAEKY